MSMSAGRAVYRTAFEISPIYLTGSSPLVSSIPGGTLPLIAFFGFPLSGVSANSTSPEMDDFFAYFIPLPGASLVDNQISTYPFANQAVAANAIITQPLQISMRMMVPVRDAGGYWLKFAQLLALKFSLDYHNTHAGLYTVLTPSHVYTNCIMTKMHDISSGESAQAQHTWQMDFVQPLITQAQASNAYNALTSKFTSGAEVTSSDWSGAAVNTGVSSPGLTGGAAGTGSVGALVSDSTISPSFANV